mmetsp:Transcript_65371/g.145885  ORF Transcript_65371/g.145885 Transcript_65371/m.145885 type:complete len:206 (-) Transcript_65371:119-736(-)
MAFDDEPAHLDPGGIWSPCQRAHGRVFAQRPRLVREAVGARPLRSVRAHRPAHACIRADRDGSTVERRETVALSADCEQRHRAGQTLDACCWKSARHHSDGSDELRALGRKLVGHPGAVRVASKEYTPQVDACTPAHLRDERDEEAHVVHAPRLGAALSSDEAGARAAVPRLWVAHEARGPCLIWCRAIWDGHDEAFTLGEEIPA